MALGKHVGQQSVKCYHCRHQFDVSSRTQSTSCPGCNKPVIVADVVVKGLKLVSKLQTCGRIIIRKRGRVIAKIVQANAGIDAQGTVDCGKVICGGPVVIGAKANWKGDCHAPSLAIELGANVLGQFAVPDPSLMD